MVAVSKVAREDARRRVGSVRKEFLFVSSGYFMYICANTWDEMEILE
jgi:hypothetical protein